MHGYPVAQGPAIPPVDKAQYGSLDKSLQQVFDERTQYSHRIEQGCFEWIPNKIGLDAWNSPKQSLKSESCESYNVIENESAVAGAASLTNLSVVYTCNLQTCKIHCPCSCCRDKISTCRAACKDFPCSTCSSQCTEHKLRLPRLFNPETDQYTMVTDRIDCARYMNVHSGIPKNCANCRRDVMEHQIFHHVFHSRCKFCNLEVRPIKNLTKDMSLKSFKKACKFVHKMDEKTCSYCLKMLKGSYERKIHENLIHENKVSNHKCNQCGKNYSNSTALQYHLQIHNGLQQLKCDQCDKSFVSQNGLDLHKEIVHKTDDNEPISYVCDKCDKEFSRSYNLARHKTTHHDRSKVNFDFADSFKGINEFPCNFCEKTFNRMDNLKKHQRKFHDKEVC